MDRDQIRRELSRYALGLDVPDFVHSTNELVDQHAWEKAAEEEKRAARLISRMWGIVKAVSQGKCPVEEAYRLVEEVEFHV